MRWHGWLALVGLVALAIYSVARAVAEPAPECKTYAEYLIAVEQDEAETLFNGRGPAAQVFLLMMEAVAPLPPVAATDEVAVFYVPGDIWAFMILLEEDCIRAAYRMPAALPMYVLLKQEERD